VGFNKATATSTATTRSQVCQRRRQGLAKRANRVSITTITIPVRVNTMIMFMATNTVTVTRLRRAQVSSPCVRLQNSAKAKGMTRNAVVEFGFPSV
jgi:hypothetical protein